MIVKRNRPERPASNVDLQRAMPKNISARFASHHSGIGELSYMVRVVFRRASFSSSADAAISSSRFWVGGNSIRPIPEGAQKWKNTRSE
jgi:hypothetical protein